MNSEQVREIAKKFDELADWLEVKSFAETYYKDAIQVAICSESEYNDEGGLYETVGSVLVTDKDNNTLEPDYARPFLRSDFRERVKQLTEFYKYNHPDGPVEEIYEEDRANLPAKDCNYDLTKHPEVPMLDERSVLLKTLRGENG